MAINPTLIIQRTEVMTHIMDPLQWNMEISALLCTRSFTRRTFNISAAIRAYYDLSSALNFKGLEFSLSVDQLV